MLPELVALDDYRIRRDWSWPKLSQDMKRAGVDVPPRTLHYLLNMPRTQPLDRTLYKIRVYLKFIDRTRRRNATRRARRADLAPTPTAVGRDTP